MIKKIKLTTSNLDEHTLEVIKKSSSSLMVKVGGMIIGLAVSIFLGRILGPEGLGVINLSHRIATILMVFGLLGFEQVIVKNVAIGYNKKDFKHIGNVMHTSYWINGGLTTIISLVLIFLSPWIAEYIFEEEKLTYPLMLALLGMTPQVFSRIFSSALIGYGKIWQSNLVNQALSTLIVGLFLLIFFLANWEITIIRAAIFYAISRILVSISVGSYWKNIYHHPAKRTRIVNKLMEVAKPLFVTNLAGVITNNADIIILGIFVDTKQIGIYTVASRIALLTSFILQVANSSVAPKIAAMYEKGDVKELQQMIQRVTRMLTVIGFIVFLILFFAGKPIIGIWGKDFIQGYWILVILAIGQLVNLSTGSSGFLLIMTGHQKIQRDISLISGFIGIVALIISSYFFGIIGVALSSSLILIGNNIARVIMIRKKINIRIFA